MLWHCWLGGRKSIRPVKNMERRCAGVVICLERDANDLHMVQLMPPRHLLLQQNPERFILLVPAYQVFLEKRPLNSCVCACVSQTGEESSQNLWLVKFYKANNLVIEYSSIQWIQKHCLSWIILCKYTAQMSATCNICQNSNHLNYSHKHNLTIII